MKFGRCLSSTAAKAPANFQSDTSILTPDLVPLRLYKILQQLLCNIESVPCYLSIYFPFFWASSFSFTLSPSIPFFPSLPRIVYVFGWYCRSSVQRLAVLEKCCCLMGKANCPLNLCCPLLYGSCPYHKYVKKNNRILRKIKMFCNFQISGNIYLAILFPSKAIWSC